MTNIDTINTFKKASKWKADGNLVGVTFNQSKVTGE